MPPLKRFKKTLTTSTATKEGNTGDKQSLSFSQERFTGPTNNRVPHSLSDDEPSDEEECCGEDNELVLSSEEQDNSDVADPTPILPTWLKFVVSLVCWGYVFYMVHWREADVVAHEDKINSAIEWYMWLFQNLSTIGGGLFAALMLFALGRQVICKKGGEFV